MPADEVELDLTGDDDEEDEDHSATGTGATSEEGAARHRSASSPSSQAPVARSDTPRGPVRRSSPRPMRASISGSPERGSCGR